MYLCCLCKGKKEVYYNYGRCTYVAYARGGRKCTIIMEDVLMLLMQGEKGSVL